MKTTSIKNAIVITSKTNSFTLVARPEIAPVGQQPGVITEVVNVSGTKDNKPFSRMDIVVQLDAKKKDGQPFTLTKSYNLAETGRGLALFLKDYNSLKNASFTKTNLFDFDPSTLKDERVVVEVDYSETGKEVTSTIKTFLPPTQPEVPAEVAGTPAAS